MDLLDPQAAGALPEPPLPPSPPRPAPPEPVATYPAQVVEPTPPPTWDELAADPTYAQQSPAEKLVTFGRWHDDVYNHLSEQPDWGAIKDQFNTSAASKEAALTKDAGVPNLDAARLQVAQTKLQSQLAADAEFPGAVVDKNRNSKEILRDALHGLDPDLRSAFLKSAPLPSLPQPESADDAIYGKWGADTPALQAELDRKHPPVTPGSIGAMDQLKQGNISEAAAAVQRDVQETGFGKLLFGPAENAEDPTKEPEGNWVTKQGVLPALMRIAFINPESLSDELGYGDKFRDFMYHKPEADDTDTVSVAKGVANGTTRLIMSLISPGMFVRFGKGLAQKAADLAFSGDMLRHVTPELEAADKATTPMEFIEKFMGAAGGLAFGLQAASHGLHKNPYGSKEISSDLQALTPQALDRLNTPESLYHLKRAAPETYRGLVAELGRRGMEPPAAGHFSLDMVAGAVKDMSDGVLKIAAAPENLTALQEAAPNTHAAVVKEIAERGLTPLTDVEMQATTGRSDPATAATVADLEAAGAPATAAAEKEAGNMQIQQSAANEAANTTSTGIKLSSRVAPDGSYTHRLDIPDGTTVEQLQAFADTMAAEHLPAEEIKSLKEQVAAEIESRKPAPPKQVLPDQIVAPEGASQPVSQSTGEHVLSSALEHDGRYLTGTAANTGHEGIGTFHGVEAPEGSRGFLVQRADGKIEFVSREEAAKVADKTKQRIVNPGEPLQAQELTNAPLPTEADGNLVTAQRRGVAEPETRGVVAPEGEKLAPAPATEPLTAPAEPPPLADSYEKLTPEKEAEHLQTATDAALDSGIIPDATSLKTDLGINDISAAARIRKAITKLFKEKFLPEPLTDTVVKTPGKVLKHPVTGEEMPEVLDKATGQTRFQYTGKPEQLAAMLDVGAPRIYVPADLVADANPAIHFKKDADGRHYVASVDVQIPGRTVKDNPEDLNTPARVIPSRVLNIDGPGQLTPEWQSMQNLSGKAAKMKEINDAVESKLADKKLEAFPMEDEVVDPGLGLPDGPKVKPPRYGDEGYDVEAAKKELADPGTITVESKEFPVGQGKGDQETHEKVVGRVVANTEMLADLGITPGNIKNPGSAQRALENISRNRNINWTQRLLAKFLIKMGHDFSKIELSATSKPLSHTQATWTVNTKDLNTAKVWLNAAGHYRNLSEVASALTHELVHHVTLFKLDPGYKRNVYEQHAYKMLNLAYDHAVKLVFKNMHGHEASEAQLRDFKLAQAKGETVGGFAAHPGLYWASNLQEFAAESLSNTGAQLMLSKFKGLGIASVSKWARLVRQGLMRLFTGSPITEGSLLDDAVSHAFTLATTPHEMTKLDSSRTVRVRENKLSVDDLHEQAKGMGFDDDMLASMPEKEIRSIIEGTGNDPIEAPAPSKTITGDGMIAPSGAFMPTDYLDSHWETVGKNQGGEAGAGLALLSDVEKAEFDKAARDPQNGRVDSSKATQFFLDKGFVRVTDQGDTIMVEGKLTPENKAQLIAQAEARNATLIHDQGGTKQTVLSEPAAENPKPEAKKSNIERKAAAVASDALTNDRGGRLGHGRDLVIDPDTGNPVGYTTVTAESKRVEPKVGDVDPTKPVDHSPYIAADQVGGKVTHKLVIPETATAESLENFPRIISDSKIPKADKTRMLQELSAELTKRLTGKTPSGVANARIDAGRAARGLSPRMEPLRRAMGESWNEAMQRIDDDATVGTRLVNDVNSVTRGRNALTPVETAILAHEQVKRENEFDAAVEAVNTAKTREEGASAQARVSAARQAMEEVYQAADRTGTWAGQSLQARKILVNDDYTLARMENLKRAAKGGEPLNEEDLKKVATAFKEIKDLRDKADVGTELVAIQRELDALKKLMDAKTSKSSGARVASLTKDLEKAARTPLTNDQLLDRYKKSLTTRMAALQKKIDAGDFTKNVRAKTHLDQEALDLQAAYKRARQKFDEELLRDEAKRRPLHEKILDQAVDFVRAGAISSPLAFAKLLSAAAARTILSPTENVIGHGLAQLPGVKQVAALAPREGRFNASAEAKSVSRMFSQGIKKDFWQVLKTGKTDLDVMFGRPDIKPRGVLLEVLGRTHAAIKAPVLRAEFERSFEMRYDHAKANKVDVSDPMVRMDMQLAAFRDAEKAIFKNNNRATDAYKAALAGIERKNQRTGKSPALSKVVTSLIKSELPVVGVPTNIAAETMQYVFGAATGSVKLATALARGVEKLHPDEADQIMRHLKKGSLGLAAAALAFFLDKEHFEAGGFYERGETRGPDEVEAEGLKIAGVPIPKYLLHNPYILTMQVFGAARRAADEQLHGDKAKGVGGAALAGLFGLGESIPFTKLFSDIHDSMDDNKRPRFLAETLKSDTIPQLLQFSAKMMDKDSSGEVVKRKADFSEGALEGIKQTMQLGIPGQRANVPER